MPTATVDAGTAVPAVGTQQLFEQTRPDLGHRRPDRHLHPAQVGIGTAQRAGSQGGQPVYFGGDLRRDLFGDLGGEPPFSACVAAGATGAAAPGGRASQIASLTSTICSDTCANR
ncbi:hypothetical protein [Gordonia rhizosphera]|uniref:hypothetical protein n=1 Tax=Gordonia rhizosphera TaxID=83341 RepID=UPI001FE0007E|nr:hypothetical protein [Gordonia rhizosphera]